MLLNGLKKIIDKLFRSKFISKREEEIFNIERAINRDNQEIDRLYGTVSHICPCCRYAALGGFNGKYEELLSKNERRGFWLKRLKDK